MARPGVQGGSHGFTLVEVMVAMTIMSLVVTVAFAGLSIGIDSWERGSNKVDEIDQRMIVERLLKRQLALAYPALVKEGDQELVLFRGSSRKLEFISDYSLVHGQSDFRRIDYMFNEGEFFYGEKDLFSYSPGGQADDPGRSLGAFSTLSFRFFSRTEQGEPVWSDEWKVGMGLPVAVQVEIDGDVLVIPLANRP